jgi:hypothetical protein
MPATPLPASTPELPLRDIHLPQAISWWPIAPGWWILLAAIVLLVVAIIVGRRMYKRRQINREIQSELDTILDDFRQHENKVILARRLSELLRRASLSLYSFENPAGLTGEAWLAFLSQTHHAKSVRYSFDDSQAKVLIMAPYLATDSQPDFDAESLTALCTSWLLQKHGYKHARNRDRGHGQEQGRKRDLKQGRQHDHQHSGQAT